MKKVLCKSSTLYNVTIFIVTLFSIFLFSENVLADNVSYDKFDWNKFYEENKGYIASQCVNDTSSEECKTVLSEEKEFYEKLYRVLSKYEKQGFFLEDDYYISIIFFGIGDVYQFTDTGERYDNKYNIKLYDKLSDKIKNNTFVNSFYINPSSKEDDSYDLSDNIEDYSGEEELDTIKILTQNSFAYSSSCLADYGEAKTIKDENGDIKYYCEKGIIDSYNQCKGTLANYDLGYVDYFTSMWSKLSKVFNTILRRKYTKNIYEDDCEKLGKKNNVSTDYVLNSGKKVDYNKLFDFLINQNFLDNKVHNQYFYRYILEDAKVDCMSSNICSNSLEAKGVYDDYKDDIKKVRKKIVNNIIEVLKYRGFKVDYSDIGLDNIVYTVPASAVNSLLWPIGTKKVREENGIKMANGTPDSTDVILQYGMIVDPIDGTARKNNGIDISGLKGVTNVVSSFNGEVYQVVNNCIEGDFSCNDGYGNTVIISHNNGDYTVYAHLDSIDDSISIGTSVLAGQYIGKVGKTGKTNTPSLHYEIRRGGSSVNNSIDPLTRTNPNSISTTSNSSNGGSNVAGGFDFSSGNFSAHTTTLTREEFISKINASSSNSSTYNNIFKQNAGVIYDASIKNNVNPEFVVVRALVEGMSPGGSTYNYWGISCYNSGTVKDCKSYSSLEDGIAGLANLKIVKENSQVAGIMSSGYAFLGTYWYNPGSWSAGGCPYFPYIKQYMDEASISEATTACSGPVCNKDGSGSCTTTSQNARSAYVTWQVNKKMGPYRYNIFGI